MTLSFAEAAREPIFHLEMKSFCNKNDNLKYALRLMGYEVFPFAQVPSVYLPLISFYHSTYIYFDRRFEII